MPLKFPPKVSLKVSKVTSRSLSKRPSKFHWGFRKKLPPTVSPKVSPTVFSKFSVKRRLKLPDISSTVPPIKYPHSCPQRFTPRLHQTVSPKECQKLLFKGVLEAETQVIDTVHRLLWRWLPRGFLQSYSQIVSKDTPKSTGELLGIPSEDLLEMSPQVNFGRCPSR